MKKSLPLLSLLLFGVFAIPSVAQTVYTQTTLGCSLNSCSSSKFSPAGTLSYSENLQYYGGNFSGFATWNGTEYADFSGSLKWLGYGNHYPYGTWSLQGTFNGGLYSVAETFECFRTCGSHSNVAGTVVGP
jgi:hypothetical protein